ncbi:hypothetical protein SKAU_G00367030 [Synaphobranchus kaupii]|uniref:Uncharacterized protein n=1 Tax=Synaphobranchus kaupii TaxID=118154 RepID=A0A9Q1EFC9_SYNKA|nr:hypothetical protein SKAU_G00367030 [Synaphobranchus kaupii]
MASSITRSRQPSPDKRLRNVRKYSAAPRRSTSRLAPLATCCRSRGVQSPGTGLRCAEWNGFASGSCQIPFRSATPGAAGCLFPAWLLVPSRCVCL